MHEDSIKELRTEQASTRSRITEVESRVRYLEDQCQVFSQGMIQLGKLSDKVEAFMERFRVLEEKHFELTDKHNWDIDRVIGLTEGLENKISQLSINAEEKLEKGINYVKELCGILDVKIDENAQESWGNINRLEKRVADMVENRIAEIDISTLVVKGQDNIPMEIEKDLRKLTNRIQGLESLVMSRLSSVEATKAWDSLGVAPMDLANPQSRKETALEMQNVYARVVNDVKALNVMFQQMQIEPNKGVEDLPEVNAFEEYNSITDKLKRLDTVTDSLTDIKLLESRVKTLELHFRKGSEAKEDIRPQQTLRSMKGAQEMQGTIEEEIGQMGALLSMQTMRKSQEEVESEIDGGMLGHTISQMDEKLFNLGLTVQKVLKNSLKFCTRVEMEELFRTYHRQNKAQIQSQGVKFSSDDIQEKLTEFEQRLNMLWKRVMEVADYMEQLQKEQGTVQQILELEHKVKIESLVKSFESFEFSYTEQISKIEKNSYLSKSDLDEIQSKVSFMMPQLSSLKKEVTQLKGNIEAIRNRGIEGISNVNQINLDEIPDELTGNRLTTILQQHDTYIKALSQKVFNVQYSDPNYLDPVDTLRRLEALKQEMKEMIQKQDKSSSLTQKDFDIINEIRSEVDTKISRSELIGKVGKPEIQRMYKALKSKIDEISSAMKVAPGVTRNDAFFTRNKLDTDCAACGQALPQGIDQQNTDFQPWSKFPPRVPPLGPGFSRILQSLVPKEGGLYLPKRSEVGTSESPRISKSSASLSSPRGLPRAKTKGGKRYPIYKY